MGAWNLDGGDLTQLPLEMNLSATLAGEFLCFQMLRNNQILPCFAEYFANKMGLTGCMGGGGGSRD